MFDSIQYIHKKTDILDMPKNRKENPHALTHFLTKATP
jgi:hypothetical protein